MVGTSRRSEARVRDEAAAWIARLQGARGSADQQEFEKWLAQDPAHQGAYDRIAAIYARSAIIRASPIGRKRSLEAAFPRHGPAAARGLIAAGAAILLMLGAFHLLGAGRMFSPLPIQAIHLSTGDESRTVRLDDGSSVRLAPSSEVRVELAGKERRARLEKGQARFSIVKEVRPFIVEAGVASSSVDQGEIQAEIRAGVGTVTTAAHRVGEALPRSGARHSPGRAFGGEGAVLAFRSASLAEAVAAINQSSDGPLIELEPGLADLRVTGLFKAGDARSFAESLAAAFDLSLVDRGSQPILLKARK